MHKARRIFIIVLFFALVGLLSYGLYYKSYTDEIIGNKMIGFAIVGGFFVLMPTFIYHRWKDKKVDDYMLTKENIMKMKEYNDAKER